MYSFTQTLENLPPVRLLRAPFSFIHSGVYCKRKEPLILQVLFFIVYDDISQMFIILFVQEQ